METAASSFESKAKLEEELLEERRRTAAEIERLQLQAAGIHKQEEHTRLERDREHLGLKREMQGLQEDILGYRRISKDIGGYML